MSERQECVSFAMPQPFAARVPLRRRLNAERGASLVEYAFVVILFFTVIFGISGFGHALFVYHHLNHAAKEATRYAAVRGSTCTNDADGGSCQASNSASGISGPTTEADVKQYVKNLTPPSIDSTQLAISICGVSDDTACADSTPTVCTQNIYAKDGVTILIPATSDYPGCTTQVKVAYAYNFIFPLIPSVTTKTAPCTQVGFCLTSTSEMIIAH